MTTPVLQRRPLVGGDAAVVPVEGPCNDRCVICPVPRERRHAHRTAEQIGRDLARVAAGPSAASGVVLAQGEPTLAPGWLDLVRTARRAGLPVGIVTNGRMFAYAGLARAAVRAGLGSATVTLHGPDAATHEAVARSDGFAQALEGARHLAAHGVAVTLRVALLAANVPRLAALAGVVARVGAVRLELTLPRALEAEAALPTRDDAAGAIAGLMAAARALGLADRVDLSALPCCWAGTASGRPPEPASAFAGPCSDCSLRSRCPGLPGAVIGRLGDAAALPRRAVRSNSFNLTPRFRLPWPEGDACPVLRLPEEAGGSHRHVYVRDGGDLVRYDTRTGDFVDGELREVLRTTGQLYLDVSDKDAPDDFAADLRKLRVDAACQTCPRERACGRAHRVDPGDVFGPDDAAVAARVSALRGDVLDIGCGHGPYGALLAPLAERGALRYVGLEPDADRVRQLQARWPWATVIAATAEAVDLAPASFDHVLVLRSYNHLAEPRRVMAAVVRALRPGGTLLVVDNVAFGLVRSREAAARAEAGPAEHEHYRNDGAADALLAMRGLPLEVLARADVGPDTSNQWFLHLRKRGAEEGAQLAPAVGAGVKWAATEVS